MSSSTDDPPPPPSSSGYAGWIFRLNFAPKCPSCSTPPPGAGASAARRKGAEDEGVDLLSWDENDVEGRRKGRSDGDGGNEEEARSPPAGGDRCVMAELWPHGAAVVDAFDLADGGREDRREIGGNGSDGRRRPCWSYSSQNSSSGWSVESSEILTVAYRPAEEALPKHTNVSRGREYWDRTLGGCARPVRRFEVAYGPADVDRVEAIATSEAEAAPLEGSAQILPRDGGRDGIWIRGVGKCHGLRVHFKPKLGVSAGGGGGGTGHSLRKRGRNDDEEFLPSAEEEEGMGGAMPPDDLPPPDWERAMQQWDKERDADGNDDNATKGDVPPSFGPVVTFAVPCHPLPNVDNDEGGASEKKSQKRGVTMADHCPPLLWKVEHPPDSRFAVDSFAVADGTLCRRRKDADADVPSHVYVNGYQSWSYAGSVAMGERQPRSAMPGVLSAAFNRGGVLPPQALSSTNYSPVDDDEDDVGLDAAEILYKSNMFACITSDGRGRSGSRGGTSEGHVALDENGGPALVVGFLSQRRQFGVVSVDGSLRRFRVHACAEGLLSSPSATGGGGAAGPATDWAYCQIVDADGYDEEVMVDYVDAAAGHNGARPLEKGLTTGWCSWYHYYEKIDHDSLVTNAQLLKNLRDVVGFNVCLVDDGYMTKWGDWDSLKPGKFHLGGMRALADSIRERGMKPGVWLAPYACDKGSRLARDHPDWIIRNDRGRIANSSNCGKFFYGLDATNPAVRRHVYDTVRRAVDEWGFEVLKLDFLYAACLAGNGKHDPTTSRAEAMNLAMRTIRAAAGKDVFIVGCGCPVGSGIGYVDGMRVSCDTGPSWYPTFPLPWWDNGTLPALRGMLRNTLSRAPLGHRWWHNDPDCILLGDSTNLTDNEVVSAASVVALTGGMFLLSDDLEKVSELRLRVARKIFPLTGAAAVPLDLHSTSNGGMPSVLRLWCSDDGDDGKDKEETTSPPMDQSSRLARAVSFSPDEPRADPSLRKRSSFSVAPGLGTWTIVSLSNWLDRPAKLSLSFLALIFHSSRDFASSDAAALRATTALSEGNKDAAMLNDDSNPGEEGDFGFHVFAFWASKYVWIPHESLVNNNPFIKKLESHETEIFHIKPANPTRPQYIGSDLHFTCGFEVQSWEWTSSSITVRLKNDFRKEGAIYIYIPGNDSDFTGRLATDVSTIVNGKTSHSEVIARPSIGECRSAAGSGSTYFGRVIRVAITIRGNGAKEDGTISLSWQKNDVS